MKNISSRLVLCACLLSMAGTGFAASFAWQGTTEIVSGRGERGPWRQNDSQYDYVDDPAVAIDSQGEIAVAWVEQARKDVFFHRFSAEGGKKLPHPVNVSRNPATFSWLPRIVIAPDHQQKIFILWQEIIFAGGSHGGDIFFARSEDGGATFSPPVNLSDSIGGDGKGRIDKDTWHNGSQDLVAGSNGVLYAAWTEYDGRLWFSRLTGSGNAFSRPKQIAGGGREKPVRAPSLALGPDRAVYLAWTTGDDNGADIHLMKSTDNGETFSTPVVIAPSKSYSDAPKIVVDRSGVVHLVYAESAGGPFAGYRVLYTRSQDGGRTFSSPLDISTPAAGASAAFPSMAIDGKGRIVVMWERYPDRAKRPQGLAITVSDDGGMHFSPPELVPGSQDPAGGTNGSHQGLLMKKLAVNAEGAIAIVNSSLKQDEMSRVWLIRGRLAR